MLVQKWLAKRSSIFTLFTYTLVFAKPGPGISLPGPIIHPAKLFNFKGSPMSFYSTDFQTSQCPLSHLHCQMM